MVPFKYKSKVISLTGRQLNIFPDTERPKHAFLSFYRIDMFLVTRYILLKVEVVHKIQLKNYNASITVFDGPTTVLPKIYPTKSSLYLASTFQCLVHALSKTVSNIMQFSGVIVRSRKVKLFEHQSHFHIKTNRSKVWLLTLTLSSLTKRVNITTNDRTTNFSSPNLDCKVGDIFAAEEINKRWVKKSLFCDFLPGQSFISQSSAVRVAAVSYCTSLSAEFSFSETSCTSISINPCAYTHWCLHVAGRTQHELMTECVPYLNTLRQKYGINFTLNSNKLRVFKNLWMVKELVLEFPLQENQCIVVDISVTLSDVLESGSGYDFCKFFIQQSDDYQNNVKYLIELKGRAISTIGRHFVKLNGFFQKYCSNRIQCQTNLLTHQTFLSSNPVQAVAELHTPVFSKQLFLKTYNPPGQQSWLSLVMKKEKSMRHFKTILSQGLGSYAAESKHLSYEKVCICLR